RVGRRFPVGEVPIRALPVAVVPAPQGALHGRDGGRRVAAAQAREAGREKPNPLHQLTDRVLRLLALDRGEKVGQLPRWRWRQRQRCGRGRGWRGHGLLGPRDGGLHLGGALFLRRDFRFAGLRALLLELRQRLAARLDLRGKVRGPPRGGGEVEEGGGRVVAVAEDIGGHLGGGGREA